MLREIFSVKHAVIFLASVLSVYLFSTSTSPLYNNLGDDSSIFQAVGKGWTQGLLPYVDLFENKGALVFLFDALGYMIYPRSGIMVLQVPMTFITFLFTWRTLGLFLSGKLKVAAAVVTLIYYAFYSIDGNRTEEWSMPFLMMSTYYFLRTLKAEQFSCPTIAGFVYGLGFGACTLLRVINGLPICCYAILSTIFLIQARDFNSLRRNVLNFCLGFAIICLPFVIYFAAHGALYDMLYGTIILNVFYSAQRENYLLSHIENYVPYVIGNFMPLYWLIIVSLIEFVKSKSRLAISGLISGSAMLLLMFKLSPYYGYCALNTPLLVMLFAVLAVFLEKFRDMWSAKGISIGRMTCKLFAGLFFIYPIVHCNLLVNKVIEENSADFRNYYLQEVRELRRLKEVIPPEERNSVMFWGEGLLTSHWILATDIYPRCRFFSNTRAFASVDPNVKVEWLSLARNDPPQWIIYNAPVSEFNGDDNTEWIKAFRANRDTDVEHLLQERYTLADKMTAYFASFRLYRLKK